VGLEHALRVARITVALRCDDERVDWHWTPAARRFLVDVTTDADVHIDVRVGEPALDREDLLFDSGGVWRLLRDGSRYRIECRSAPLGEQPYKTAFFDDTFTRGEIVLAPRILPLHLNPLEYPLDEVLIANLLARGRGVELHSCGVIDRDGRGRVFAGMSGAGKTTTARLWEPSASGIISDDRVIVREQDGAMWMYGTPWHGEAELSMPTAAPLAGVYLLVQSDTNELRELPRSAAIMRLFGCSFPPFYDADAVDFTLAFLDRLVQSVPVRELHFTPDASVVDLVRAEAA
jgi:hypothetical protein